MVSVGKAVSHPFSQIKQLLFAWAEEQHRQGGSSQQQIKGGGVFGDEKKAVNSNAF
jgi:hypothetical protein